MRETASNESRRSDWGFLGIALLPALCWSPLHAQTGTTDYQLRVLAHTQQVASDHRVGVAGWVVLPDVANTRPVRTLLLAGVVLTGKARWLELMGGALLNTRTAGSGEVDLRFSDNSRKWLNFYFEAEYNFGSKKLLLQPIATTPVRIGSVGLRVGAESDLVFAGSERTLIAGPRVVLPLRVCRSFAKDCGVSLALRLGNGTRVLRQIVSFNF